MPTYCYRRGRRVVERVFSVRDRPETITVKGLVYKRDRASEFGGVSVPSSAGWPMECLASGVHASQAGELRKFFSDHGCPTEVTADGNPVYRSAAHRKKALKLRGFRDNSSYI
jgi:hypothetical protein